jgi:hypothetical protein
MALRAQNKRESLIVAGKQGHKILLFGEKVFNGFAKEVRGHPNATIATLRFPGDYQSLARLSNYSLVIADYAAFETGRYSGHMPQQAVFYKMMVDALKAGTVFCFVFFDEYVPEHNQYGYASHFMDEDSMEKLLNTQIGYRWLHIFDIRPHRANSVIVAGTVLRNELRPFFDKWGASHLYFESYGKPIVEPLVTLGETTLAMALSAFNSKILFLPFQRDSDRKEDFLDGLSCLVDCLLTYITKSLVAIPEWAAVPFFSDEAEIRSKCEEIEATLQKEKEKLIPFQEAKGLLFQSEYSLESSLPRFFEEKLSLRVQRDEKYKEDFWILDDEGKHCVIVEIKSASKGFKKTLIFSAYAHREANGLDEQFPTLLIANCNLQAGSWADKIRPIDRQDYEVAAQNSVLVMRVEDIVRLWHMRTIGKIDSGGILNLLLTERGWLEITAKYSINVWK